MRLKLKQAVAQLWIRSVNNEEGAAALASKPPNLPAAPSKNRKQPQSSASCRSADPSGDLMLALDSKATTTTTNYRRRLSKKQQQERRRHQQQQRRVSVVDAGCTCRATVTTSTVSTSILITTTTIPASASKSSNSFASLPKSKQTAAAAGVNSAAAAAAPPAPPLPLPSINPAHSSQQLRGLRIDVNGPEFDDKNVSTTTNSNGSESDDGRSSSSSSCTGGAADAALPSLQELLREYVAAKSDRTSSPSAGDRNDLDFCFRDHSHSCRSTTQRRRQETEEEEEEEETLAMANSKPISGGGEARLRRRRRSSLTTTRIRSFDDQKCRNQAAEIGAKAILARSDLEAVAIVKSSFDPVHDFQQSMAEMVAAERLTGAAQLKELLLCYLSLNSHDYHDAIFTAFRQMCDATREAFLDGETAQRRPSPPATL